jgi:dipeptide/tripeptide permease
LSINIGSLASQLLTPVLRSDVKCFDNDCFPLAFGVPALAMLLSIVVFAAGTPFYTFEQKKPKGKSNIILLTIGCMFYALKQKIKSLRLKDDDKKVKDHWLEYADDKYDQVLINDVKAFCRVLFMFIPVPVAWALFDQQGSRWTSQAQRLNGIVTSSFDIKPDQFQAVNGCLIILLVPTFDYVIYPLFAKIKMLKKLLHRIALGLFLVSLSFFIAAMLENRMQTASADKNPLNQIRLINTSPCNLVLTTPQFNDTNDLNMQIPSSQLFNNKPFNFPKLINDRAGEVDNFEINLQGECNEMNITSILTLNLSIPAPKNLIIYLVNDTIKVVELPFNINDNTIGVSEIEWLFFNPINDNSTGITTEMIDPILKSSSITYKNDKFKVKEINESNSNSDKNDYAEVDYGNFNLIVNDKRNKMEIINEKVLLETCGRYTVLLFKPPMNGEDNELDFVFLVDITPNGIHLVYQFFQIFMITSGEILFSVSGVAFAYAHAPKRMKSVLQATWLLTVAVGNLIVVIVAETKLFENQFWEYIFFGCFCVLATGLFIFLMSIFKYPEYHTIDENEDEPTEDTGILNPIFDNKLTIDTEKDTL